LSGDRISSTSQIAPAAPRTGSTRGGKGTEVKLSQQVIAEFVGTLALVFIGAGSVVILSLYMAGNTGILGIALAHGLVLAVMVTSLGHISGGHFNPAVTAGVWVTGKIESLRAAVYIVAQLAGAAAGAGLLRLAVPEPIWS